MIYAMKSNGIKKLIYIIAIVFSAGWIVFTFYVNRQSSDTTYAVPQKGFIAPNFTLIDLNDVEHELTSYQGKIVILNIWASWCKPCQYEMPALQSVFEKYKDEDVVLLAINSTFQDSILDVENFVNSNALTFPILLDSTGEVSNAYQVQALPSTFFIAPNGKISDIVVGGPMSKTLIETKIEEMKK